MRVRERLKAAAVSLQQELEAYRLVLRDGRTPGLAKFLLGAAVFYTLMPFDVVPDFIPVVGQLDDVVIVPLLVVTALSLIPRGVVDECRWRVRETRATSSAGSGDREA